MAITPAQRKILNLAMANDNRVTLKQIVESFGDTYYRNGDKYLGEILSRMVKSGLLIREKPGVFTVGDGKRPTSNPVNSGEASLFD